MEKLDRATEAEVANVKRYQEKEEIREKAAPVIQPEDVKKLPKLSPEEIKERREKNFRELEGLI